MSTIPVTLTTEYFSSPKSATSIASGTWESRLTNSLYIPIADNLQARCLAPQESWFRHSLQLSQEGQWAKRLFSLHAKGIEVYKGKPILYGCGDFLNDYEGIGGYEAFRDDLALMYFVTMSPETGELVRFRMIPTQIKRFRVNRASAKDARWLGSLLNREGARLGTQVEWLPDNTLALRWSTEVSAGG